MGFGPKNFGYAWTPHNRLPESAAATGSSLTAGQTQFTGARGGLINATEANVQVTASKAMSITKLRVKAAGPAAGGSGTAQMRIAGADVGAVLTWAAAEAVSWKEATVGVAAAAGDALSVVLINGSGTNNFTVHEVEWEAS